MNQDSVCSPLSPPPEETGDSYPPSLPARGLVPEPHYSVPQNNTRVKVTGEGEGKSKTLTTDEGVMTKVRKDVKFIFVFSMLRLQSIFRLIIVAVSLVVVDTVLMVFSK